MKPLYIFLLALCAISCSRNIDFDYLEIEPLTVIEATLTPDGARVAITRTTPMDEPMNKARLTDAVVTLTDLTDGETVNLEADDNNFFVNPTPGVEGHVYRLTVERNGEKYSAETQMFGATEIAGAGFGWISMPYDEVAVLQVEFFTGKSADECYWIRIYRNGEILSWSQTDDRMATDGLCSYVNMISRKNPDPDDEDALKTGDVVTVNICRISRQMFDYLETIANDSNGTKLFSGPRVLGYFLASTPAETSVTFDSGEF